MNHLSASTVTSPFLTGGRVRVAAAARCAFPLTAQPSPSLMFNSATLSCPATPLVSKMATNMSKWCIPEKNYKNVAEQCWLDGCSAVLQDFVAENRILVIFSLKFPLKQKKGTHMGNYNHPNGVSWCKTKNSVSVVRRRGLEKGEKRRAITITIKSVS